MLFLLNKTKSILFLYVVSFVEGYIPCPLSFQLSGHDVGTTTVALSHRFTKLVKRPSYVVFLIDLSNKRVAAILLWLQFTLTVLLLTVVPAVNFFCVCDFESVFNDFSAYPLWR